MKCRKLAIAFLLLGLTICRGADTVAEVSIRSSTKLPVSPKMVQANIRLKKGEAFTHEQLAKDIKSLFATGCFYDIQVDVEAAGAGRVKLIFQLTPKPRVRHIRFQGNHQIKTKLLRRKLTQMEHAILQEKKLSEDLNRISTLYKNKGYRGTGVHQRIVGLKGKNDVDIIYEINERPRYLLRKVKLTGNRAIKTKKLRRAMKTKAKKGLLKFLKATPCFDAEFLRDDLDKIRDVYWAEGYFDARVVRVEKRHRTEWPWHSGFYPRRVLDVIVHIEEGKPYRLSQINLAGNQRLGPKELRGMLALKPGAIYKYADERAGLRRISRKYQSLGYLDSNLRINLEPDVATHTVAATCRISEGKSSRIRHVNIAGNRITHDKIIRRNLSIHPGDPSDLNKIQRSRRRVLGLRYFSSVEVVPAATEHEDLKDLNVKVREQPTGRLMLSLAFSDIDRIVGGIEFGQSNFDLAGWGNSFMGAGQRFWLRAQTSKDSEDYRMSFTEPWLFNRPLRLSLDLWRKSTASFREYDQSADGARLRLAQKLKWRYWQQSLGYRRERIEISNIDEGSIDYFSPEFEAAEEGEVTVSALTLGIGRDSRNDYTHPSRGSRLRLSSEYQSENLGSYTDIYKLTLSAEKYFPIFRDSVLKLSTRIGHVNHLRGADIKVFDRYFAGGSGSIRGFEPRAVGPRDDPPLYIEPVGGNSILLASVEAITPLAEDILFGAIWADAGNVWEDTWGWEFESKELNISTGFGIRIKLQPAGAISLDYGWPVHIDPDQEDYLEDSGRLHFNVAYSF